MVTGGPTTRSTPGTATDGHVGAGLTDASRRSWLRVPASRPTRMLLGAVLALVLLVAGIFGGAWAWVQRGSSGHVASVDAAVVRPVGLVLGAGLDAAGRPSPFLAGRLDVAAELYRQSKVSVLLVSGDNRTRSYNEPDAMRSYLVARGVPGDSVVADYAGRDTYDSCVRARRVFGVDGVTVISQGYHVPRAVAICRAVGLDAQGVGDWSAQQFGEVWRSGERRELLANVKAAADVVTGRDPVLGEAETSVTDALKRD